MTSSFTKVLHLFSPADRGQEQGNGIQGPAFPGSKLALRLPRSGARFPSPARSETPPPVSLLDRNPFHSQSMVKATGRYLVDNPKNRHQKPLNIMRDAEPQLGSAPVEYPSTLLRVDQSTYSYPVPKDQFDLNPSLVSNPGGARVDQRQEQNPHT